MLLIIGNGFDLQSKLKSDYKSFFANRYTAKCFKDFINFINEISKLRIPFNSQLWDHSDYDQLYSNYKDFQQFLFQDITFWDVLFIFKGYVSDDKGWHYIEKVIKDFLTKDKSPLNGINKSIRITKYNNNAIPQKMDFFTLISFLLRKSNIDSINHKFVMEQLNILENSFRNYLENITFNNYVYQEHAQATFDKISKNNDSVSIISFNYTLPKLLSLYSQKPIQIIRNVHGNLKTEIIFGIDQEEINENDNVFQFTKTARILHSYQKSNFRFPEVTSPLTIAFYGHSLSEMDYSYFQSIFDYYDIYSNSKISLEFFYSVIIGTDEKYNVTNRVIRLLKKYGRHINKGTQGDNLLHKLFLENRIKITVI